MARSTNRGENARKAGLREVVARIGVRERGIAQGTAVRTEIDAIRRQVAPLAEAQGRQRDEDVFREVS